MKSIYSCAANPDRDADARTRCPGTRLLQILTVPRALVISTEQLSTYRNANLSEQHAQNRLIFDLAFLVPEGHLKNRGGVEREVGGLIPQPFSFADGGAFAGLVLQGATDLPSQKAKKNAVAV
jgi:hypothetical protein